MFGQSNSSPFGAPPSSTPFGSSANSTPAFGSPTPAPFGNFGGGNTGGGFGAPAPAPFGSNTTGFGAPASSAPFGGSSGGGGFGGGGFGAPTNTSPFGAPAPSSGLFGAPAPAPSGGIFGSSNAGGAGFGASGGSTFGGFGATNTNTGGGVFGAPAPSVFGSSTPSVFGAPAPGAFGAPAPSAFGANNPSVFGAPAPGAFGAPAGGGFGAPAPTAFGAPAPTAFGATNSSVFGAPTPGAFGAPTTSAFGAPATGGGLFGAPAPAPSFGGFGSSPPAPSGGMFGAPAPTPGGSIFGSPSSGGNVFGGTPAPSGGGLFGAPQQQQGVGGGSTVAPYQATSRQDGTSMISLHSISAMNQYENKSFEELRYEDYSLGNKGDSSGNNTTAGGFSFGAPASGGFGAPAPASSGLFGAPAVTPPAFGAPTAGAFGAPAPSGGFGAPAFGAPAPAAGGFAFGASTPAPAFGGFGAKPPAVSGGLFGAPAPAPSGGLFGAPAPAPSGGLFGSPAPAAFGAPASGGLFGSAPAPSSGGLFGGPAPASGGLFGSPAPAFGGFGSKAPAPGGGLFGAPAPSSGLFGAAPAAGGGLFGSPAPAPGAFGAPPASGGLFGMAAPAPTPGIFGAPTSSVPPQNYSGGYPYGPAPTIIPPAADAVLVQQLAAVQNQRKELEKLDVWRGKSPQQSSVLPSSLSESDAALWVSPYSTSSQMSTYRASPKSAVKIRPRGFGQLDASTSVALGQLGNSSPFMSPGAASSAKHLVIKPEAHTPKPSLRLRLMDGPSGDGDANGLQRLPASITSPPPQMNGLNLSTPTPSAANKESLPFVRSPMLSPQDVPTSSKNATPTNGAGFDFYRQVVGSPRPSANTETKSLVPKLTKPGYIVTPSLQELSKMSEAELATVSGFSILREGFGNVVWEGAVDVRGVDLDAVVNIGKNDIAVYEQQELEGTKPPQGSKLNRSAILTIPHVLPKGGDAEAVSKFTNKLKKTTAKLGAEFISYDSSLGEWVFRVSHFSKYGILDDDSDDEVEEEIFPESIARDHPNFESGERGGRSPEKASDTRSPTRFTAPTDDNDEMKQNENIEDDEVALISDVEMITTDFKLETTEEQILEAANHAYQSLSSPELMQVEADLVEYGQIEKEFFPNQDMNVDMFICPLPIPPNQDRLVIYRSPGICSRIAQSRGISFASETDFGLRMGRSFRVGWGPDGSFLCIRSNGIVIKSRPIFSESQERAEKLLEVHRQYATKSLDASEELPCFILSNEKSILSDASDAYSQSISSLDNGGSVAKQAFALISTFLQEAVNLSSNSFMLTDFAENSREMVRIRNSQEAFKGWMREACSQGSKAAVRKAEQRHDAMGAVFAALSSGNLESATSLASKYGYHQLAAMIAVGPAGAEFVKDQVRQWQVAGNSKFIADDILRVYTLLGGNLKVEEELYRGGDHSVDWKRRLGMLLFYTCDNDGGVFDFERLVDMYQVSVDRGVAPKPQSEFCKNDETCLLYRLISIGNPIVRGEHSIKYSMADVISPTSHAIYPQDFAASFHLAVALSAIGCCSPLSETELVKLYDGYAAQLISTGQWELAVYVMLCSLGEKHSHFDVWRYARAKQFVLSHYNSTAEPKRDFLVKIGLPGAWFDECLATQAAMCGDAFAFINHAIKFAPDDARVVLEETVVPSLLFRNAKETLKSLELLRYFASDDDTLSASILHYFRLCESVMLVGDFIPCEKEQQINSLVKSASNLKKKFTRYKTHAINGLSGYKLFPGAPVSMNSFLAEVLSGLNFVNLQLSALQAGESIWDEEVRHVPMKLASQLTAGSGKAVYQGALAKDQQIRGLI